MHPLRESSVFAKTSLKALGRANWLWPAIAAGLMSASAHGQTVTLADLQGVVVDISAVVQERIIRSGQTMYPRLNIVGQLKVGPEDSLTQSFQTTSRLPDGRSKAGPHRSRTFTLGKPQIVAGYDTLWLFSDGSLIRLQVHGQGGAAGGNKMMIAFTRGQNDLGCTLSYPMTPEVGVGKIRKPSSVDGVPIQILEFKMVSSTCRVRPSTHR